MTSNSKLYEYGTEIIPMFRELDKQKDLLKDFKESDEKAIKLVQAIKDAQEELKKYLEEEEWASEVLQKIKDINKDIKVAVAGAANGEKWKPAELKGYYAARAKDKVEDVVEKGELFVTLNSVMGSA